MNRMLRLSGVAILCSVMFVGTAETGESDPNATNRKPAVPDFAVCRGNVRVSGSARPMIGSSPQKVSVYLSDIMPRGPVNDQDIAFAFEQFLTDRYGQLYAAVECRAAWTRAEAAQIRDVEFRQGPGELTFIDTGWQYKSPAKVAAPAAKSAGSSSAASAAPTSDQYAVCWANMNPKVKYYSAVFDGSRDDAAKWWPAFQKYLQQQYGFNGPTQCIPARAQADAESYLTDLIARDGTTRTTGGQPPQIVRTDWKY